MRLIFVAMLLPCVVPAQVSSAVSTIPLVPPPASSQIRGVAVNPNTNTTYLAASTGLKVIVQSTLAGTYLPDETITGVAVNAVTNRVYVVQSGAIKAAAVDPGTDRLYAAYASGNAVSVNRRPDEHRSGALTYMRLTTPT